MGKINILKRYFATDSEYDANFTIFSLTDIFAVFHGG